MFVGLGIAFVAFQGSNAVSGLYAAVGAADLSLRIENGVQQLAAKVPAILGLLVLGPVGVALAVATWRRRLGRAGGSSSPDKGL